MVTMKDDEEDRSGRLLLYFSRNCQLFDVLCLMCLMWALFTNPFSVTSIQSKMIVVAALVASATAFAPAPAAFVRTTAIYNDGKGAGGMYDTRDPEPFEDEDPRKSISAAPSFEEYMKQRAAEAGN
jgi:hypothetical protein